MSDFTGLTKHVGVLNNTGKNVVVAFMSLPDDPNYALVIDTDALPDSYNDALRRIVESNEGQQAKNLADILGRRISPDGSQKTLLVKFHESGKLHKVPVNLISMTPRKGVRLPLVEVLKAINMAKEDQPLGFDELDPETRAAVAADLQRFNVHANNMIGENTANRRDEAVSLIRQAELLESDAQTMRIRAYQMDPSMKRVSNKAPTKEVAPVTVPATPLPSKNTPVTAQKKVRVAKSKPAKTLT